MGRAEDLFARVTTLGEQAIDEFILDRQSEELFLDFKRSSDNGAKNRLSDRDRDNLAKAISGFGNSEGGIVVWGVDCRPNQEMGDVAATKVRIENAKRYKSWLEGAVSGLTIPPHPGVQHLALEGDSDQYGFVVSHIPRSYLAPHQCVRPRQYYMRVGSSFEPVPHGVLAGMFGRTPQPMIFHMWSAPPVQLSARGVAQFEVGLLLTNRSPAIARDVYLSVTVSPPGGESEIGVRFPDLQNWSASQAFGSITQVLSNEGFRLAPTVVVQPIIIVFALIPPFQDGFRLKITLGCAGSAIKEHSHELRADQLQGLFDQFRTNQHDRQSQSNFVKAVVGGCSEGEEPPTYEETAGA